MTCRRLDSRHTSLLSLEILPILILKKKSYHKKRNYIYYQKQSNFSQTKLFFPKNTEGVLTMT
jgi:hypothetical protein